MNEDLVKQLRKIMREEMHLAFDSKFEQIDKHFEQVDKRFEQVDKRFGQVDKHFEQVDKRFEQVDKRFEQVDKRFGQIDKNLEEANNKIGSLITEVDHVRRLTQANYELTKFVLEKHDTQIVEIQSHLNLPTNPTKPLP